MKTLKFIITIVLSVVFAVNSYSQSKTDSFKVYGNCSSCKARIEKAAMLDGVSKATWNVDTKVLSLVYNPTKVNSDDILKKIAAAGHDNEKFRATDKAYQSLPGCCQYERKK
jgi:copper chaperone CopZ